MNQRIKDFRVYYVDLPIKVLYPFDYQYVEIFKNLLKKNGLVCPTYHHLYIQVAKTIEEGLKHSLALDPRYTNGVSVIDYDRYLKQTDKEKEQTVFDVIVNGLMYIVDRDKLDLSIVDKTIEEIKKKGLDTELEYLTIENNKYKLTISYLSGSMEEECPIYFNLIEKDSHIFKRIQIGAARNDQIYFWLQKVTLTNTQIKVKSSASFEADIYLKGKARNMMFKINDLLNE